MRALKLLTTLFVAFAVPQIFTDCFADENPWPPELRGATNGTVTLKSKRFLKVPDSVVTAREKEGAADFVMAKKAPTIDLAFHRDLGPDAISRRLWSSWGDICVASESCRPGPCGLEDSPEMGIIRPTRGRAT